MANESPTNGRSLRDREVVDRFLDSPSEESFEDLFHAFTPQVVAFFVSQRCEFSLAEDLAQEVMLTVYHKSGQLRDRRSFRGWLFKIALNVMRRHYDNNKAHGVEIVDLATVMDRLVTQEKLRPADTPAFEFLHWMAFLDLRQSEVMELRFIEQWEYHEIAAEKDIPIGTVKWRIFNAKKKLAPYLSARQAGMREAA
ncbi:MAG TPA: sigma-70 family RNA polymerase sigma factor [Candidatus Binatia bacterium]|nr:sigma-70 family RNA polymerase sigma factor [Candidatus Binatia bacterium]